jgi:hypothetical protein
MSARICPVVTVGRWANGSAIDPDERIRKDQLKAMVVSRQVV